MAESFDYLAKIIFVGDSDVGKSCLLFRLADQMWYNDVETTIGVEFRSMKVSSKKYKFKLQLWDTSGQEKFRSIVRSYYRQGTGCLLVFDITNHQSFRNLEYWYQDLQKNTTQPSTNAGLELGPDTGMQGKCILLIGTKSDLSKDRVIDTEQALEFVKKHDLLGYVEVSAKTGSGMDQILSTLTQSFENLVDLNQLDLPSNSIVYSFNVESKPNACCLFQ